jgi:hypothetical protein
MPDSLSSNLKTISLIGTARHHRVDRFEDDSVSCPVAEGKDAVVADGGGAKMRVTDRIPARTARADSHLS